MATSKSEAVVVGGGGGTTNTTSHSETIVGSHVFRIGGFSATKDLGVGKSIKSSTFRVGGHGWYIDCYPCGDVEESAGWVSLLLCRCREDDDHGSRVSGYCEFTLMESLEDGCFKEVFGHPSKLSAFEDNDTQSLLGIDLIKREELEWLLEDDCLQVRCVVSIQKFPAAPPPPDLTTETMAGSHVLTVDDGYSKLRRAFVLGEAIKSSKFFVGGHSWCLFFYPWGQDENDDDDRVSVSLVLDNPGSKDEVKVRFEITLLTHAGQIIASTQDFSTFTGCYEYVNNFLIRMEHESSPLVQDGIQIRCDIEVVNGITATPNLRRGIGGDIQGSYLVGVRGDVTFEVGGHLFAAHKCVLTTRCTAFMADIFGPAGDENAGVTQVLHIEDMEPRVFQAFLHFIYTDALPDTAAGTIFCSGL